jgi:hypothetical protein
MSGGGFYFDLRIQTAGYAWAAWRMEICLCRVRSLEMTVLLMSLSGAAFMEGRRNVRKVTFGGSQGTEGSKAKYERRKFGEENKQELSEGFLANC